MCHFKFASMAALALSCLFAPIISHADGWTVGPYKAIEKSLTPTPSPNPDLVAATYDPSRPSVSAIVRMDGVSATADVTYKATATYEGLYVGGERRAHETGGISGIATRYGNGYPQATSTVLPQSGNTLTNAISYTSNPSVYNDPSGDWEFVVGGDFDKEVSATIELIANGRDNEGYAGAGGTIGFILPVPPMGGDGMPVPR